MFRLLMLMVLCVGSCLAGCAAPSYTNIPPLPGDTALHSPNDWNVLRVERAALAHVLEKDPPSGRYAITLPQGTSSSSTNWMIHNLPSGGGRADDTAGPIPVYEVAQVRIRGLDARVDIIRPHPNQDRQLVSVFLDTDIKGWYATRDREWHTSVGRALRMARPGPTPAAVVE